MTVEKDNSYNYVRDLVVNYLKTKSIGTYKRPTSTSASSASAAPTPMEVDAVTYCVDAVKGSYGKSSYGKNGYKGKGTTKGNYQQKCIYQQKGTYKQNGAYN